MKKFTIIVVCVLIMLSFGHHLSAKKKVFIVEVILDNVIREPELTEEIEVINGQKFEDEIIKIIWSPDPMGFHFELYNKLKSTLSIIWDECSFIDKNSDSHKVLHSGTRYIERDKSILPTTIPLLAKKTDLVYPSDLAYFGIEQRWTLLGPSMKWTMGPKTKQWCKAPIFIPKIKEKAIKKMKKYEPDFDLMKFIEQQNFRVVLVLKSKDQQYNYHFFFKSHLISGSN